MRWRPGHLALLVFQALWLNIALPGHTRGAISLAGADCDTCSTSPAPRACHAPKATAARLPAGVPTPKQKANCAVCAFAAQVTPPPPVSFAPVQFRLLPVLSLPPPQLVSALEFIPTYYGNGPPLG